ncbi:failed axon connections-like [Daphnia pulicaria]|uniref:failed axon connections-like n=1 Tax=Daphnia pulicaria TaxID=35523 RepID=UPI001EEB794F|nr:failed axon connections-like [Daphnia pulicaria]
MSNDEKTTVAAPVDSVQQVNNKEVEEKQLIEEQAKNTEATNIDNGKSTQQVEATTDAAAKEATPNPAPPAPKPPKPAVHKVDFEKNVVYLYQFSRTKNIPSPSPFCLKVETWLRMAGIKYENVDHKMRFRSAKGQLPFVEVNGAEIADSAVIVKELGATFNTDMDAHLTSEQRNVAHATITMLESHYHWIDVWWRSKNQDAMLQAYKIDLQHMVGSKLPAALLKFYYCFSLRRRGMKKVRATGIGVHSPKEIIQMGKDDLKVLADMLGDKTFFFGDEPTTLDVVVFANVAQLTVIDKDVAHPLRDWVMEDGKNLVQHFERIKEKYYPDWQEMCDTLDMNTHIPKPVKEEKEAEKVEQKEEEKKEEDKEKVEDEKEKEKESDEKTPATEADENQKETK